MSSSTIAWDINAPANSDFVAQGAAAFRSVKSSVQSAMFGEHTWGDGVMSGVHKAGSARVFMGPTSQVSSADTDGRLMVDSSWSRLWYVGSGVTYLLGGRTVPSLGTLQIPAIGQQWAMSLSTQVTIVPLATSRINVGMNSDFSWIGKPFVGLTVETPSSHSAMFASADLSNFALFDLVTIHVSDGAGQPSASTITVHMQIIGKVEIPA